VVPVCWWKKIRGGEMHFLGENKTKWAEKTTFGYVCAVRFLIEVRKREEKLSTTKGLVEKKKSGREEDQVRQVSEKAFKFAHRFLWSYTLLHPLPRRSYKRREKDGGPAQQARLSEASLSVLHDSLVRRPASASNATE
jgi:hypothetical protein